MTKARKKFDSAFKAQIALEVLGEVATVLELARRQGVHQNQIYRWKKLLLDNAASLFGRGVAGWDESASAREREAAKLYAKTGQPTVDGSASSP